MAALLDTGARPSVIDMATLEQIGLAGRLIRLPEQVYGLCKSPVGVKGYIHVEIQMDKGDPVVTRMKVLDSREPTVLLGREFLKEFGSVTFDFAQGRIGLGTLQIPIKNMVGGNPIFRAETAMKDEKIATVDDVLVKLDINEELDKSAREEVLALCRSFSDRFAENPKRPERTLKVKHYINTGDNPPVKSRPRKFPPNWEQEIERQVSEMIGNGICRESKSPWASNVVLVRKRDGSMRFAIDYRGLNDITKKDAYSLPNPQHILDKLHGAQFFTSLDVASAYWCVPVHEADIEKTSFYTPRGQHEMLVMPFGLCNSQATYQRLMDHTLSGLEFVESFVDDCLIFSHTFQEHMEHVRTVLQRLRDARIQLRSVKCHLDFLGHHITPEGRTPVSASAELLLHFPRPKCVKELQSFLGSVNFYRAYIV